MRIMAPQSATTTEANVLDNKLVVEPKLDCNHNEVFERTRHHAGNTRAPKRPVGDVNERVRKLIKTCFHQLNTNLNVLVIGPKASGKTSLINSMNMALTQEWKDRAKYCPGRNHVIDECVMYHNKKAGGKVVFYDTRGFEDIHNDDHAVLILRYVLEGRIPAKCIPCVLLMSKETIKKRYHKIIEGHRRIDLVLNVAALNQEPQTRLMNLVDQAIRASKHTTVNKIPIVTVATKGDLLDDEKSSEQLERLHEYSLETLVNEQRRINDHRHSKKLPTLPEVGSGAKLVDNYRCELEPWSDESINPSLVRPSPERDTQLLAVWRDIVSRTAACGGGRDRWKRAYSATSRPMCRCLPFRFDYMRLRSASF